MAAAICWENYMPLLRQSLYAQNVGLYLAPTADARDTWAPLMQTVGAEGRCFVLSANQCQKRNQLPEWIRGSKSEDSKDANGAGAEHNDIAEKQKARRRRSSVVSKTEDGHEINWPVTPIVTKSETVLEENPFDTQPSENSGPENAQKIVQNGPPDDDYVSRGGSCIVSPTGQLLRGPIWEVEDELLIVEADFEDCERGRLDLDVAGSYSRNDAFKFTVVGLDLAPPP